MDTSQQASSRLNALVLCGLAFLVAATCLRSYRPHTYLFRDGSFYAQTNRSIARGLTLRQEEFQPRSWYDGSLPWYQNLDVAWSNVSVGSDGEWYPKHSVLMPIVSTPFYVVFGLDGLLVFNALMMVLSLFFGFRLGARFSRPEAAAVGAFVISGCPLVPYLTYAYSHDVFYAALVAGGLEAIACRKPGLGGFLLGLSLVAKVTNILVAVPVGLALAGRDRRTLARATAFGAAPVSAYAAANWAMYGSPVTTSYHRILTVHQGVPSIETYDLFGTPLVEGLRRFFTSSPEGELWPMAPVAVVAYTGCVFLARRSRAIAAALFVSFAAFALVFARYRYGGARFFMPWLSLSVAPGAALVEAGARGLLRVREMLAAWSGRSRAAVAGAAGVLVLSAVGWSWWTRSHDVAWSAERDVERLKVSLDSIPCDYFNMTHQKWECSHLDPGGRYHVGLALGDECPGMEHPTLYVPAHPGARTRIVRWAPEVVGSGLRVTWRWMGGDAARDPRWTLRVGKGEEVPMPAGEAEPSSRWIAGRMGPDLEVVLTLPGGPGDGILCVSLEVVP